LPLHVITLESLPWAKTIQQLCRSYSSLNNLWEITKKHLSSGDKSQLRIPALFLENYLDLEMTKKCISSRDKSQLRIPALSLENSLDLEITKKCLSYGDKSQLRIPALFL